MNFFLFNTLIKTIGKIKSIQRNQIYFYACGPTVYDSAHLGNLRTYLMESILKSGLLSLGYQIRHTLNITDVGHLSSIQGKLIDKVSEKSLTVKKNPYEITKYYERLFFQDCKRLNISSPNIICKATEHIYEIQKLIRGLEKKKFAYNSEGNLYYKINRFSNYTRLSSKRNKIKIMRIDLDLRKKNLLDFALWFSKSKFKEHFMKWDSPWGIGFPGWHIECSAMSARYLGAIIDIHAGGIDHIQIHHTNEIAQCESYFGKKWVNIWMHVEFLIIKKEKMSKSLGNFTTLQELINNNFLPVHYRYLCLSAHYKSQLIFNYNSLIHIKNTFEIFKNRIIYIKNNNFLNIVTKMFFVYKKNFWKAILNNINTSLGLSIIWGILKSKKINNNEKNILITNFELILRLRVHHFCRPTIQEYDLLKIKQREEAKKRKNYKLSDFIRKNLEKKGIILQDIKFGTNWLLKIT